MFYKIATFTLFLIVCNAQEHLTCLRTALTCLKSDDVKGFNGEKGSKGEPGIPDISLIKELKGKISILEKQMQTYAKNYAAIQQGYKVIGNGWVTIFNGYQYKVTPGRQSWDASRNICRRWGGDLAVYGVQSMTSRRILLRALPRSGLFWIGLSDKATEGRWRWVNNNNVVQASALWSTNQPDDYGTGQDCGVIQANNAYGYGTDDGNCGGAIRALCEKRLQ